MFPYPSGRIHMGHVRNYAIGDAIARYKRMCGYEVLHPMGWDAFGMPAENAAIKHGVHPATWTEENIATMRVELARLGLSYDWQREIATCRPDYYRFEQKFFIDMLEKGLAYRKESLVNWCTACQTVLANEQVVDGTCWRCDTAVVQKPLMQWFFKITHYAQSLLEGLDSLQGWPDRVTAMQREWIGRSEGLEVHFPIDGREEKISIFTTRPDTLMGVTFLSLAAEHPLVAHLVAGTEREAAVRCFAQEVAAMDRTTRLVGNFEKKGLFLGAYAHHPITRERIPIYAANFVLLSYGTGAVMAVPAHDQRDFEFAKAYHLPITLVVQRPESPLIATEMTEAYTAPGVLINSGDFDDLDSDAAKTAISEAIEHMGTGKRVVNYRLRDWGISRQRYWGTPIPIIYCECCGALPVAEADLPVVLPLDGTFTGEGGSPLAQMDAFVKTTCPACQGPARRETDTMDTFVESSWYFLRYTDPQAPNAPFRRSVANHFMPVDQYIGGVLRDLGYIDVSEPFTRLLTQGMVIKDGAKMSKSKGNVVDPDYIVSRYGADTARLFILFAAPPEKDLDWSDDGIEGAFRFLKRVWRLVNAAIEARVFAHDDAGVLANADVRRKVHETIKKVSGDIEAGFHFNSAIAALMELTNTLSAVPLDTATPPERVAVREGIRTLTLLLGVFVPHIADELWSRIGGTGFTLAQPWPQWDEAALIKDDSLIIVQVNGKLRERITVPITISQDDLEAQVLALPKIKDALAGGTPKRVIVVPGKLVNVVV